MTSPKIWIQGARPRTLPAAIGPVLVATALAKSEATLPRALLALLVSLSLQVGVNYANDYSDGIRGTDSDRVGPIRLVGSGIATPSAVKRAALLAFLLAAIAGFTLAALTTWWLLLVGAFAILAAWAYTGGKNPYGYFGYGEISVFIFFGLVATMGSFYIQSETLTLKSFIVALPMGALSCAILSMNNIRDRAKDGLVGKRTLAVRLGDRNSRYLYLALLLIAHISPLLLATPWALLTLLLTPITFSLARIVLKGAEGKALIPLLAKTAQLQIFFSTILALALWLS